MRLQARGDMLAVIAHRKQQRQQQQPQLDGGCAGKLELLMWLLKVRHVLCRGAQNGP